MRGLQTTTLVLILGLLIWALMPVMAMAEDLSAAACADCHDTEEVDGVDKDIQIQLTSSVHDGLDCIDCHTSITELPHEEELATIGCGDCHDDVVEIYTRHGRVSVGEDDDIPVCQDCHGNHDILPSSERKSRVSAENMPGTCSVCHENIDLTTKHKLTFGPAIAAFSTSVHGRAIAGGRLLAAKCRDCHSSAGSAHRIYGANDPASTINHFNIPHTCGNCHSIVEDEFWAGIHGQLVARGDTEAPVCTHCHGEHGIIAPSDPRSPVSPLRVAEATCSPCHESAYINDNYGVKSGELISWYDSYHGLKSKSGDVTVANCASCHEAHLILPHTDPKSSIYADNLQHTCGQCHEGISAEIAATRIHEPPGDSQSAAANIVKSIYIVMIVMVIGGMLAYVLIDFRKQVRLIFKGKQYRRMTVNEVWQHYCLVITFVTLVITGFSLRYAESWWTKMLFGFEGGFALRGLIHRIAGVAFIITSVWHALFLLTARGRQFIIDMFPVKKDIIQVYEQIVYNLGITKTPPEYDRFGYVEKAEYWALVWGTLVMVVTGLILWFENTLIAYMPKTLLDVTLVVHYYEAWLASLAILVWHLYSTVFSPKVYPMNPSWFKGKMPLHMYDHEHGNAPADPADIDPNGSDQESGGEHDTTKSVRPVDRSQQN